MSENTLYKYEPATVKWDAVKNTKYGDLEALDLTMSPTLSGRMDIWSVPKCDAYPEGYFVGLTQGANASVTYNEPGCESWKKHLLASVEFMGVSAEVCSDDESHGTNNRRAVVTYQDPAIPAVQLIVPERTEVTGE